MPKTLKFASNLVPLVLSGEKTSTWRLFDDKDLQEGDDLAFVNKETGEVFAHAMIVSVREKRLGDITLEDEVADGHERYESDEDRLQVYRGYYGEEVMPDTMVKMVKYQLKERSNSSKVIWDHVEKALQLLKLFPLMLFIIYAMGFLAINIYLFQYGIFEFHLLQTRFISTGILFVLFLLGIFLLVEWLLANLYGNKKGERSLPARVLKNKILFYILIISTMLSVFPLLILDKIPQYFGGMMPMPVSVIGDPEDLDFFTNFQIGLTPNAEGKASVQTLPVCLLYQSQDDVLIGVVQWLESDGVAYHRPVRVLYLKQGKLPGLQVRGGSVARVKCNAMKFSNL